MGQAFSGYPTAEAQRFSASLDQEVMAQSTADHDAPPAAGPALATSVEPSNTGAATPAAAANKEDPLSSSGRAKSLGQHHPFMEAHAHGKGGPEQRNDSIIDGEWMYNLDALDREHKGKGGAKKHHK